MLEIIINIIWILPFSVFLFIKSDDVWDIFLLQSSKLLLFISGMITALLLSFLLIFFSPLSTDYTQIPIVSLSINDGSYDSFVLGTGVVHNVIYYYYYEKVDRNSYRQSKVETLLTTIQKTDTISPCLKYKVRKAKSNKLWFLPKFILSNVEFKFDLILVVPENTVIR